MLVQILNTFLYFVYSLILFISVTFSDFNKKNKQSVACIWYYIIDKWAFWVAQMVKNLPAMGKTWVRSLGWENPMEEGMATHSSILTWRIPIDRGAWQATVHGVKKSWTWLSNSAQHVGEVGHRKDAIEKGRIEDEWERVAGVLSGVGSTPASAGSRHRSRGTGDGSSWELCSDSFAFPSKVGSKVTRWVENGRLAERGESLKWISSRVSRPWDSDINTFPTLHNPPGHQSNLLAAGNLLCWVRRNVQ